MWHRFQEGGLFTLITLGTACIGLTLALVTVGLGLARRGRVLAIVAVLWSVLIVASGVAGSFLARRQVVEVVRGEMLPSRRNMLLSVGLQEAQSPALFGVLFAVLPAFVSLLALALALRPSAEQPAPPRAGAAISAFLMLAALGGGLVFWKRGPPPVEQRDDATWRLLDAEYMFDHPTPDTPYKDEACKLMEGFAEVPADAPARKLPGFPAVASKCVEHYVAKARATRSASDKPKGKASDPEAIVAKLERSTWLVDDAHRAEVAKLKKELEAAKRKPPRATIKNVSVLGLMDVEAIRKLLEGELAAIADCYAAGSKDNPLPTGSVVVLASLLKGAPSKVELRPDPGVLTGVPANCAKKAVEKLNIGSGDGLATIVFEISEAS
jgi:hypothetical protein